MGKIKWDSKNLKEYVENNSDCTFIDFERVNFRIILKLKCKCGNEFKTTIDSFKAGKKQCNDCSILKTNYLYNVGDIVEMKNGKIEVLELTKYKSGGQQYVVKCLNCGYIRTIDKKGMLNKNKCVKCSENVFKISEDELYWIGITQNNEEFWFNGDKKTIEYIKSYTWRKIYYGYFQNKKGEKLHRVVMGVTNPNIFINHLGGNRSDCRKEMLSISDCVDNSREKNISSRNSTGIVGLLKRGKNNKYVGNIKPNGIDLYSKYKEKNEALIDLLIMQKYYGFRHNQDLWYMLNNISEERIKEVLINCERQINTKRNHSIKTSNKIELSENKDFYWVYDSNNNKFKISLEAKDMLNNGIWYVAQDKNDGLKSYVKGCIVENGTRKSVKLHRYLMNLNKKYKKWFVDHINGDGLDNRFDNLEITDSKGNGHKSKGKGYYERSNSKGVYRVLITLNKIKYDKTFHIEQEAINYVKQLRENFFKNRLSFKNKKELDEYLNNNSTEEEIA